MIRGVVNVRHEAVVRLRLRGPGGVESDVDAIVDTGFTSSLTLPATMVTALSFARQSGGTAMLADGSVRPFDICAAEVAQGGAWRAVLASVVGNEPLLGMGLLAGHKLGGRGRAGRFGGDPSAALKRRTFMRFPSQEKIVPRSRLRVTVAPKLRLPCCV